MKINGRKLLKRLGWTALVLATLSALFYAIENWRGARSWEKTRNRLVNEGEPLTLDALLPPPVPPEENFFTAPLLAAVVDFEQVYSKEGDLWDSDLVYRDPELREQFLTMRIPEPESVKGPLPKLPSGPVSPPIDLAAWADHLESATEFELGAAPLTPAERILAGYEKFGPLLEEVSEAARSRPKAQIPMTIGETYPEMVGMVLPHFSDLLDFSKFLSLRSHAAIASGNTEIARDDILIQMRLTEAFGSQPILIGHLCQLSVIQQVIASIREGLRLHAWSDDDLRWLEEQWDGTDLPASTLNAFRGEMAFFLAGIQFVKTTNPGEMMNLLKGSGLDSPAPPNVLLTLIPSGWMDQNAVIGSTALYESCILPLKENDFTNPSLPRVMDRMEPLTPYNFFARLSVPAVETVLKKAIHGQNTLALTRVACALERYHLEHGRYPTDLEALKPAFLSAIPSDPMTQAPLRYALTEDSFTLYSLGWNRTDEGGKIETKQKGRQDLESGDWAW